MSSLALIPAEVPARAAALAGGIDEKAMALRVSADAGGYQDASALLITVRGVAKSIREFFKPYKDEANQKHKAITAEEAAWLAKTTGADAHLVAQMRSWEQRAAEAAARVAEAARIKAAEEQKAREAAALKQAEAAEASGHPEAAAALIEQAAVAPMPVLAVPVAQAPAGMAKQKTYKAEVRDAAALIAAVAAGKVPMSYVSFDLPGLNREVRKQKRAGDLAGFPGVAVIEDEFYRTKVDRGGVAVGAGGFAEEEGA